MIKADLLKSAHDKPLSELAKQVIQGVYTPGVEDVVLIERLEEMEKCDGYSGLRQDGVEK